MSEKLPALQFYPGDWRKDPGVQSLSYHDRGVWFEMLMLMHGSEPRGKLLLNGKPIPEDALGRLLGLDNQTLKQTITTLLDLGVASLCPDTSALMNRRMVRDEHIRKVRKDAGKKGGNPALIKHKPTTEDKQTRTTRVKQKSTPSSSSSISSSESNHRVSPEAISPAMVASAVLDRCRLSGRDLRIALEDQARIAANAGEDLDQLTDCMVKAWDDYQKAKPNLAIHYGAEKFFGECWRNPDGWAWKKDSRPRDPAPLPWSQKQPDEWDVAYEIERKFGGFGACEVAQMVQEASAAQMLGKYSTTLITECLEARKRQWERDTKMRTGTDR